jgi:hypothetical protein
MKPLTAQDRTAEVRGVSLLLVGPTGIGKTSQIGTLFPEGIKCGTCGARPFAAEYKLKPASP